MASSNGVTTDKPLHQLSPTELLTLFNELLPNSNQTEHFHDELATSLIKLCSLMNFQFCLVGLRLPPKTNKVQTLFYIEQGKLESNFIYEVDEGPCETVFGTEKLVSYSEKVRNSYPNGPFLNAYNIEAFIGVPIMIKGRFFGLCNFFRQSPIADDEFQVLKSFIELLGNQISLKFESCILATHLDRISSKLLDESFSASHSIQEDVLNLETLSMSVFNQLVTSISPMTKVSNDSHIEQKLTKPAILNPSSLLKSILNVLPVALYWKNRHGQFLGANKKMLDDVGLSSVEELIGLSSHDMPWRSTANDIADKDLAVMNSGEAIFNNEEQLVDTEGDVRWVLSSRCPLEVANKQSVGILGVYMDITTQKKLEQKMRLTSITDELTGLFNRRYFVDLLEQEITRANRNEQVFSLIMFDLDYFKKINDSYGHHVGDLVLKDVSSLLSKEKRHHDSIARWGGEEFMILVTEASSDETQQIAERYRQLIHEHSHVTEGVSISAGVTNYQLGENEGVLLKRVDEALYLAKRNGRNRVEFLP